jgi:NADP-dependent 3-hydroxy acid dehydrogenase YdfG
LSQSWGFIIIRAIKLARDGHDFGNLMNSLKDKVVAIVGGGTGIGGGAAEAISMAGAKVVLGGRRTDVLEALATRVDSPHRMLSHVVDVGDDDSVKDFFAFVESKVGAVDIMINSAGVNIQKRTMAAMDPAEWSRVLNINATGAYRCMAAVLPGMRARRDGLVINVSSVAGKRAIELGGVVYCASKFAMTALGTTVSNEVRNEGVRITNVYPGEVNTPLLDQRPVPVSHEHRQAILQPEDIASILVAICQLPPRAHVPEIVIKPTTQQWV